MKFSTIIRFVSLTIVVAAALASVGLTQVAREPNAIATTAGLRRHRPMRVHRWRPDMQVDSDNWSGYAVTGSSFTQAMGSWIVPTVNCAKTPPVSHSVGTYSSFWVGIDGYSSQTVEQIGTDSDCDSSREGTYYAWYEFYPADSFEIPSVAVSPGDKMLATVTYTGSGSHFTVTITDETTGKSFSKTESVNGAPRSSAEWIAEAPCCTRNGGILPLADFGTVDFGWDYTGLHDTNYAADSSISTLSPISAFGPNLCTQNNPTNCISQINMVTNSTGTNSGTVEDNSSALTSDGTSFQVTWVSE